MRFFTRRDSIPWEVLGTRIVDPITNDDDDDDDLEILSLSDTDVSRTFVFDIKSTKCGTSVQNAVVFARQQLLTQVVRDGFNTFIEEGWRVTVYRRAKTHRIEVIYIARPARTQGKIPGPRLPPFMAILQDCAW
ncbi:hypothetical protein C8J56DRAFT_314298 [Mycena floridula]|nr:hypothetical protein C8J56DRAFT_314298 [Mycena floridula]